MTHLHVMAGVTGLALAAILFFGMACVSLLDKEHGTSGRPISQEELETARAVMRGMTVLGFFACAWIFGLGAYIALECVW